VVSGSSFASTLRFDLEKTGESCYFGSYGSNLVLVEGANSMQEFMIGQEAVLVLREWGYEATCHILSEDEFSIDRTEEVTNHILTLAFDEAARRLGATKYVI
jgi:hypothetical protein